MFNKVLMVELMDTVQILFLLKKTFSVPKLLNGDMNYIAVRLLTLVSISIPGPRMMLTSNPC
jgi:hypothetical protein